MYERSGYLLTKEYADLHLKMHNLRMKKNFTREENNALASKANFAAGRYGAEKDDPGMKIYLDYLNEIIKKYE